MPICEHHPPEYTSVLPVKAVEVLRGGCPICPMPVVSTLSSEHVGWNGIGLESFPDIPAVAIPTHEHPTHFLNLLVKGSVRAEWTTEGRTKSADNGPGTIYLLPAGTIDRLTWSGPTTRLILIMDPGFLNRSLESTSHLDNVELITHWNLRDRHIESLMLAMYADLEDGSPAGPLYGESLGMALAVYLGRRYSIRGAKEEHLRGGMPSARLNRVVDFINQNSARDLRLWELADVAEMSPHYFCQLFKQSTGMTAYQYVLRARVERAKRFLRDPKLTIAQTSAATGFSDQSHFTKVFRRIVGMTPTEFRKSS
jgi:AraC family transcriptional regulator